MHAVLLSSGLPCRLRPLHARSLTTFPISTPSFYKVWDPTKRLPLATQKPWSGTNGDETNASRKNARCALRVQWDVPKGAAGGPKQNLSRAIAIRRLNWLLSLCAKRTRPRICFLLWKAYILAKYHVPTLPSLMPAGAWDVLWSTQAKWQPRNSLQRRRVWRLYHDLLYSGKPDHAVKLWVEDDGMKLSEHDNHRNEPKHLELGTRLHALAGNPEEARAVMERLFNRHPTWDASVMLPVIRSHTDSTSTAHHDMARTMYLTLRQMMGKEMTLEHYDACFVGFLQAQHLRYSIQVFRDTVKDGYLATSYTTNEITEVLNRLHMLFRLGDDIERMTKIALQVLSILPQPYHTHLFTYWLRSAVVNSAPVAAEQILDLMSTHGSKPESNHFNLLLKALFRTKDEPSILKAEDIAWRMVEEARKKASPKEIWESAPELIKKQAALSSQTFHSSQTERTVPEANITTFALIMGHHASNFQWEHVDYLERQLNALELQPNAQFMNVIMDSHSRKGNYKEVWKTYNSLTATSEGEAGVFPDGASIRCLWRTLRNALGNDDARDDPDLPTPRQLLAETVLWWSRCYKRQDAERFRQGLAAVNHAALESLMLHCFSYKQDFPGSLVALHVARTHLLIFPSNKSAATLQNQAAWVDMRRETDSARSQYHHSRSMENTLEKLGRVYYILMERRLERAGLTEEDFSRMNDEQIGDFGLNLLSEFIRVVMKRSHSAASIEAMIDIAKQEVGVPNLSTGDLNAFTVA